MRRPLDKLRERRLRRPFDRLRGRTEQLRSSDKLRDRPDPLRPFDKLEDRLRLKDRRKRRWGAPAGPRSPYAWLRILAWLPS